MISSPLMTVMVDAARKAARGLKRDFGEVENLQVSRKGPGDFVSAADRKAEEVVRDALMKARPGYGLVLEEEGRISHRAKLDGNADLAKFATTLETVCVSTVESGFMTKDLALLVGPDQKWLSTTGFLDKVDQNLKTAMAG